MMGPYSEALESMLSTIGVCEQIGRRRTDNTSQYNADTIIEYQDHAAVLKHSQPMYWGREPLALISEVSHQIDPDTIISPELLYCPAAWCWFETPSTAIDPRTPVTAVSWIWTQVRDHVLPDIKPGLAVASWQQGPADLGLSHANIRHIRGAMLAGQPVSSVEQAIIKAGKDGTREIGIRLFRLVIAASAFLRTKIAAVESRALERHARKRASKAGYAGEQGIEVVLLRQRETHAHEERFTDWQHQWIVRPHLRQQWYATKQTHLPIIVAAHLKGPEGKPLKMPSGKIFAVTR